MKKFLEVICYLGTVYCLKIEAMDANPMDHWQKVASNTKCSALFVSNADGYSKDAENAFSGAELKINWDKIKLAADKGNSLAQYVHSQHLFASSRSLLNGERTKARYEAYMYLLIAAAKGEVPQAVDDYKCAVDFTRDIPSFKEDEALLLWVAREAEALSEKWPY